MNEQIGYLYKLFIYQIIVTIRPKNFRPSLIITFAFSCISQALATKSECPLHGTPLPRDALTTNENATGTNPTQACCDIILIFRISYRK